MGTTVDGWTTLAESPLVLSREYSFGPGRANALAVRLPSGGFLVVSAPLNAPAALRALAAHGEVVALLANNGAHHLGLPGARSQLPNAKTYATPSARERIEKRSKGGHGELAPLSELTPLLGAAIQVLPADGCKVGDVLVRVETERGSVLYTGDFIANIPKLPWNPLFRLAFRLTDSAPGLKVFRLFFKFFTTSRTQLRDFLIREFEARPPAIMVPGHGDVVAEPGLGPKLVEMLRRVS